MLGDRADTPPFGVAGGGPAEPSVVRFRTGGRTWTPEFRGKQEKQLLRDGDGVRSAGRDRYVLDPEATACRRAELAGRQPQPVDTMADAV